MTKVIKIYIGRENYRGLIANQNNLDFILLDHQRGKPKRLARYSTQLLGRALLLIEKNANR